MKQKLGMISIVLLGINGIVGSGIFLLPSFVAVEVGNAAFWVILFDAVLVICLSLCFAEMAGRFKRNGGTYLYVKAAFGNFMGFEVGILRWVTFLTSWAALSVAFATVVGQVAPRLATPLAQQVIPILLTLFLGGISIAGVTASKFVNNLLTTGKLLPLLVFLLVGVWYFGAEQAPVTSPLEQSGSAFAAAMIIMFYAFTGFESLSVAASDMDRPMRNIPWAIVIVVGFVSVLYLAVQIVTTDVLGASGVAASQSPIADAMGQLVGEWGRQFILIGSVISIGGVTMASAFYTPRLVEALATDGMLPNVLAKQGKRDTPVYAALVSMLIVIPLTLSGSFAAIATINVVVRFAQYIPTCLAVLVLRRTRGPSENFQIPLGATIPIIAVIACVWLLFNAPVERVLIGLGAFVACAPLYLLVRRRVQELGESAVGAQG